MKRIEISETFIYKWRYFIGYGLLCLIFIASLFFAGTYLPGGLNSSEIKSVVNSDNLNIFKLEDVINLPYHLLQKASLAIFGVTILSIKLPSLILAFCSAVFIVLLLRRWIKPSIGVLASLIAITTGQFLFIAQDATPNITYVFWSSLLILLATLIPYCSKFRIFYILSFFVVSALSIYTPLSLYMLVILIATAFLHPHPRNIIKKLPKISVAIGLLLFTIISIPLIIGIIKKPDLLVILMGIPSEMPNILHNISVLLNQYLGFNKGTINSSAITPFFELGSMLIAALGLFHVLKTRVTSKNYLIIIWLICLLPILLINPTLTSVTFTLIVLLIATGLDELLGYWYKLFPNNPYARFAGLIPIVILVLALVFSGISRYVYEYRYDPNIINNFSNDIKLIPKDTTNILTTDNESPFYNVIANHNKNIKIIKSPTGDSFLATKNSKNNYPGYEINKIITSALTNNSDRFYLYKKIAN